MVFMMRSAAVDFGSICHLDQTDGGKIKERALSSTAAVVTLTVGFVTRASIVILTSDTYYNCVY